MTHRHRDNYPSPSARQALTVAEHVRCLGGARSFDQLWSQPAWVDGALRALHAEALHHLFTQVEVSYLCKGQQGWTTDESWQQQRLRAAGAAERHAHAQSRPRRQPRCTPKGIEAHTLACQSSVISKLGPFRSARPPKGHPRGAVHNLGTNSSAAGLSSCHCTPQAAMPHCTAQHGRHSPRCSTTGEWECRASMPRAAPSACEGKQADGWRLSN